LESEHASRLRFPGCVAIEPDSISHVGDAALPEWALGVCAACFTSRALVIVVQDDCSEFRLLRADYDALADLCTAPEAVAWVDVASPALAGLPLVFGTHVASVHAAEDHVVLTHAAGFCAFSTATWALVYTHESAATLRWCAYEDSTCEALLVACSGEVTACSLRALLPAARTLTSEAMLHLLAGQRGDAVCALPPQRLDAVVAGTGSAFASASHLHGVSLDADDCATAFALLPARSGCGLVARGGAVLGRYCRHAAPLYACYSPCCLTRIRETFVTLSPPQPCTLPRPSPVELPLRLPITTAAPPAAVPRLPVVPMHPVANVTCTGFGHSGGEEHGRREFQLLPANTGDAVKLSGSHGCTLLTSYQPNPWTARQQLALTAPEYIRDVVLGQGSTLCAVPALGGVCGLRAQYPRDALVTRLTVRLRTVLGGVLRLVLSSEGRAEQAGWTHVEHIDLADLPFLTVVSGLVDVVVTFRLHYAESGSRAVDTVSVLLDAPYACPSPTLIRLRAEGVCLRRLAQTAHVALDPAAVCALSASAAPSFFASLDSTLTASRLSKACRVARVVVAAFHAPGAAVDALRPHLGPLLHRAFLQARDAATPGLQALLRDLSSACPALRLALVHEVAHVRVQDMLGARSLCGVSELLAFTQSLSAAFTLHAFLTQLCAFAREMPAPALSVGGRSSATLAAWYDSMRGVRGPARAVLHAHGGDFAPAARAAGGLEQPAGTGRGGHSTDGVSRGGHVRDRAAGGRGPRVRAHARSRVRAAAPRAGDGAGRRRRRLLRDGAARAHGVRRTLHAARAAARAPTRAPRARVGDATGPVSAGAPAVCDACDARGQGGDVRRA
jgi:hypothetical protein